jgi:hypothetical protein
MTDSAPVVKLKTTEQERKGLRKAGEIHIVTGLLDDIDTILAENKRLRDILEKIANESDADGWWASDLAQRALEE